MYKFSDVSRMQIHYQFIIPHYIVYIGALSLPTNICTHVNLNQDPPPNKFVQKYQLRKYKLFVPL